MMKRPRSKAKAPNLEGLAAEFQASIERMKATPGFDGWARLWELLDAARKDPAVQSSYVASEFLELMFGLASDCYTSADAAIKPLISAVDSMRAEERAKARHESMNEAKGWVLSEWAIHADAYGGNKSEFARHYARRLMNEKGLEVTDRNIRERWLKGL